MQDLPRTKQKIEKLELKEVAAALWAHGIDAKVFTDLHGGLYLAVKAKPNEAPHVFREVESKEAAKNCGAEAETDSSLNTIHFWKQVWDKGER
jgi:hypothetical protein